MRSLGRYYAIRHGRKFAVLDVTTGTVPEDGPDTPRRRWPRALALNG